jgi:mannan endo-1,4-beta-mannosidase
VNKPRVITTAVTGALILAVIAGGVGTVEYYHHEPLPAASQPPKVVRKVPAKTASILGVVTNNIPAFEHSTGAKVNLAVRYITWGRDLPLQRLVQMENVGVLPLIEIEPRTTTLRDIVDGSQDKYVYTIAREVAAFKGKLAMSFGPEMNGNWYSWSNHPAEFIRAWRHVVGIFRKVAHNVTWVWIAHRAEHPSVLRLYYPGDAWVNWIGLDGYYEHPHNDFQTLFTPSIHAIRKVTKLPILITETAVGPLSGNVPVKIADLFRSVQRLHLLGLVWFDITQHDPPNHQNWNLESRPAALAAFKSQVNRRS